MHDRTTVYIVSYHSEHNQVLSSSKGQFRNVEKAIAAGEWPYDNGDDPSFYIARRGGPLTWGVCRQDVRNSITPGDIVVFFSSTSISDQKVLYRLSAVGTVASRTNHIAAYRDSQFRGYPYINMMVTRKNGIWYHSEDDRPPSQRHSDWLWRMADSLGAEKAEFERMYSSAYSTGQFSKNMIGTGTLKLANNYVVFSSRGNQTFISPAPVIVAIAHKGKREQWCDSPLKQLTVGEAARHGARQYLRAASSTGYFHRHIRFEMDWEAARKWRAALIARLRHRSSQNQAWTMEYMRRRTTTCAT